MPQSPLPDEPNEAEESKTSSASSREILMRWKQHAMGDVEPVLLEVSVGASWASTDLGRHLLEGIVDVVLEAPDVIDENVAAEPSGTPVPLGAGHQVLITCELGGAVFDA